MAGYGYNTHGYSTYTTPPPSDDRTKSGYSLSDHMHRPSIVDDQGRKRPILSYETNPNTVTYYTTKTETVVQHQTLSPFSPEYNNKHTVHWTDEDYDTSPAEAEPRRGPTTRSQAMIACLLKTLRAEESSMETADQCSLCVHANDSTRSLTPEPESQQAPKSSIDAAPKASLKTARKPNTKASSSVSLKAAPMSSTKAAPSINVRATLRPTLRPLANAKAAPSASLKATLRPLASAEARQGQAHQAHTQGRALQVTTPLSKGGTGFSLVNINTTNRRA